MNLLQLLFLEPAVFLRDVVEREVQKFERLQTALRLLVAVSLFLLLASVVTGAIAGDVAGRFCTAVGAGISLLLIINVWYSLMETGIIALAFSKAGRMVSDRMPAMDPEVIVRVHRAVCQVSAWFMGMWLLALVVPFWKSISALVLVLLAMTVIALVAGSGKIAPGRRAWVGLVTFAVLVAIGATVSVLSPKTLERVQSSVSLVLDKVSGLNDRRVRLADAEKQTTETAHSLDSQLLKRLIDEQNEIKFRALHDDKCHGYFCSAEDEKQYKALTKRIADLKAGEYWQKEGETAVVPTVETPKDVTPGDRADDPPPSTERVASGVSKPSTPRAATDNSDETEDSDDVFGAIRKYDDQF